MARDQQDLIKNPGTLQMFSHRRNMVKRGEAFLLLQWGFRGHSGNGDGVSENVRMAVLIMVGVVDVVHWTDMLCVCSNSIVVDLKEVHGRALLVW